MRILLAEDEPDLANWLARALERGGLLADWVSDG
ncbi:MAG: DNA-binding response regulator, partial [Proteobacteria bacterium]|nr:DNA-binding response regulator [Pseudomonadota bacterium]